jgi:hypothetical protein
VCQSWSHFVERFCHSAHWTKVIRWTQVQNTEHKRHQSSVYKVSIWITQVQLQNKSGQLVKRKFRKNLLFYFLTGKLVTELRIAPLKFSRLIQPYRPIGSTVENLLSEMHFSVVSFPSNVDVWNYATPSGKKLIGRMKVSKLFLCMFLQ